MTYTWCGLTLSSDFALPELPRADADSPRADWHLRLAHGRAPRRADRRWFHHWRFPDGRRWLSLARDAGGYLLRFPRLADFDVRPGDRAVQCYRGRGTPAHTFTHLLLDQVLPLTAGGRDRLSLHASVVATPSGAVAFLGPAGHGKSTLAARLALGGCPLVSDDCCLLRRAGDRWEVAPSYPGVRLRPASIAQLFGRVDRRLDRVSHYSTKRRVAGVNARVRFCDRPVPLRRLYTIAPLDDLARARTVTIRRRSTREALLDLVAFTFHLDVGHAPRVREAFDQAADVAQMYGVRLLVYPWDLATGRAVADAILDDVENG